MSIPFGCLLQLLAQRCLGTCYDSGVSSLCTSDGKEPGDCGSGVFIGEEIDGVGDKRSGATTVNVETSLETFLGDFQTWDFFPCLLNYQYFQIIDIWIKGILLYYQLFTEVT
jgi:hypothetical protein